MGIVQSTQTQPGFFHRAGEKLGLIKPEPKKPEGIFQQAKAKVAAAFAKKEPVKAEPTIGERIKGFFSKKEVKAQPTIKEQAVARAKTAKNAVAAKINGAVASVNGFVKKHLDSISKTFTSYMLSISNQDYRKLVELNKKIQKDSTKFNTKLARAEAILRVITEASPAAAKAVKLAYESQSNVHAERNIDNAIKTVLENHQERAVNGVRNAMHGFYLFNATHAAAIKKAMINLDNNVIEAKPVITKEIHASQEKMALAAQSKEVSEKSTIRKPFAWFANKLINLKNEVVSAKVYEGRTPVEIYNDAINNKLSNKEVVAIKNFVAPAA